jgi:transposase
MSQDIVLATKLGGGACPHSGRYIVDAVVLERRSPTELARDHDISRRWIHKLVKRFKEGGYASLAPRSGRPHSCSHQTSSDVQGAVLRLRQELVAGGYDARPETIAHHIIDRVERVPSVATLWRILKPNGLITPQPHKRPRSSFTRFEAKLPNVRILTNDGELIRALTLDPTRIYQPLGGRWPAHNVLTQARTMS